MLPPKRRGVGDGVSPLMRGNEVANIDPQHDDEVVKSPHHKIETVENLHEEDFQVGPLSNEGEKLQTWYAYEAQFGIQDATHNAVQKFDWALAHVAHANLQS